MTLPLPSPPSASNADCERGEALPLLMPPVLPPLLGAAGFALLLLLLLLLRPCSTLRKEPRARRSPLPSIGGRRSLCCVSGVGGGIICKLMMVQTQSRR